MTHLDRDIGTEDLKIGELVRLLREDKFLIPTFQRDFVWVPAQILKLWESMYRFYPIGSILYWETDAFLHTHRKLGGFTFPHDEDTVRKFRDWRYILDGQQRVTSIFVSMMGGTGRVEENEDFDYTLYFDATEEDGEFFFQHTLARRTAHLRNAGLSPAFLLPVRDVPNLGFAELRTLMQSPGYNQQIERNVDRLQRMFRDYKLSLIRIRGVDVDEVCEIFERINQEGRKLDTVDIIIARTYRPDDAAPGAHGFYLRDRLDAVRNVLIDQGSRWQEIDDLTLLQMVGVCLRKQSMRDRNPFGITAAALANMTAEEFEATWPDCQKAILDTIKFLSDQHVHGPNLLPYTYLMLPICFHYFRNRQPNRDRQMIRQWFWRNVFRQGSFNTSSEVYRHCEAFARLERGERMVIDPVTISRRRLINANYQYRNAFSRAVLAFLAYLGPRDFTDARAAVLDNVYLDLRQTPNLHHIYPRSFLDQNGRLPPGFSRDSLMNICFLRALTNTQISDRNPIDYFKTYAAVPGFDAILESHLIPREFIERTSYTPEDYRSFLNTRADLLANKLKDALPDVRVTVE